MSWTIIDQDEELHIRAIITDRAELDELVKRLQKKLDGEPGCITSSSHGHVIIAGEKNHE